MGINETLKIHLNNVLYIIYTNENIDMQIINLSTVHQRVIGVFSYSQLGKQTRQVLHSDYIYDASIYDGMMVL